MPSAPSGGTASMVSGVALAIKLLPAKQGIGYGGMTVSNTTNGGNYDATVKLPSGGTWRWISPESYPSGGENAGGTTIRNGGSVLTIIAIRIS